MNVSNYVIVCSVRDEDSLLDVADLVCWWDCPTVVFHEPDLGKRGEHTALATIPVPRRESRTPTRPMDVITSLPLLGKEVTT